MLLENIHQRYGGHIAKRIELELPASELAKVKIEQLLNFLEDRAEAAHSAYQTRLDQQMGTTPDAAVDRLCQVWHDAEDLAYLISVAEDVSLHYREASRR